MPKSPLSQHFSAGDDSGEEEGAEAERGPPPFLQQPKAPLEKYMVMKRQITQDDNSQPKQSPVDSMLAVLSQPKPPNVANNGPPRPLLPMTEFPQTPIHQQRQPFSLGLESAQAKQQEQQQQVPAYRPRQPLGPPMKLLQLPETPLGMPSNSVLAGLASGRPRGLGSIPQEDLPYKPDVGRVDDNDDAESQYSDDLSSLLEGKTTGNQDSDHVTIIPRSVPSSTPSILTMTTASTNTLSMHSETSTPIFPDSAISDDNASGPLDPSDPSALAQSRRRRRSRLKPLATLANLSLFSISPKQVTAHPLSPLVLLSSHMLTSPLISPTSPSPTNGGGAELKGGGERGK